MKNNKKGFTLVELVIVVAVMAILVAVAIPTIGSISTSATKAVQDTNARSIESIIKLAEAEAVKNSGESAIAGSTVVTEQQVWNALTAAKLGIEEGTYCYNSATGTVEYGAGTASATVYNITFDDTNPIEVVGDATVKAAG